jgi:hypothetical protein
MTVAGAPINANKSSSSKPTSSQLIAHCSLQAGGVRGVSESAIGHGRGRVRLSYIDRTSKLLTGHSTGDV